MVSFPHLGKISKLDTRQVSDIKYVIGAPTPKIADPFQQTCDHSNALEAHDEL